MAAVLGRQAADEGRPPQGLEAVAVAEGGKAGEQGVDEHRPAIRAEGDVVGVHVAGDPGLVRGVEGVVLARLAALGDVVEAEDLIVGGQQQGAAVAGDAEAHAPCEGAFEHRQAPVGLQSQEEQLAGLVGGQGEAHSGARQPLREVPGGRQRELFLNRRRRFRHPLIRRHPVPRPPILPGS